MRLFRCETSFLCEFFAVRLPGCETSLLWDFSPQLCVGFLFLILYPGLLLLRLPPPLSHTLTHSQLCHIASLTYNNFTYNNTHTLTHSQLCHIASLTYTNFTYNNFTHTQLCHIASLTLHTHSHTQFCHTITSHTET